MKAHLTNEITSTCHIATCSLNRSSAATFDAFDTRIYELFALEKRGKYGVSGRWRVKSRHGATRTENNQRHIMWRSPRLRLTSLCFNFFFYFGTRSLVSLDVSFETIYLCIFRVSHKVGFRNTKEYKIVVREVMRVETAARAVRINECTHRTEIIQLAPNRRFTENTSHDICTNTSIRELDSSDTTNTRCHALRTSAIVSIHDTVTRASRQSCATAYNTPDIVSAHNSTLHTREARNIRATRRRTKNKMAAAQPRRGGCAAAIVLEQCVTCATADTVDDLSAVPLAHLLRHIHAWHIIRIHCTLCLLILKF